MNTTWKKQHHLLALLFLDNTNTFFHAIFAKYSNSVVCNTDISYPKKYYKPFLLYLWKNIRSILCCLFQLGETVVSANKDTSPSAASFSWENKTVFSQKNKVTLPYLCMNIHVHCIFHREIPLYSSLATPESKRCHRPSLILSEKILLLFQPGEILFRQRAYINIAEIPITPSLCNNELS
jgi:hypothetical protein